MDIFTIYSFSESYFTVKGAALILPQSDETAYTHKVTKSHAGKCILQQVYYIGDTWNLAEVGFPS